VKGPDRKARIHIGIASFPENGSRVQELLDGAGAALRSLEADGASGYHLAPASKELRSEGSRQRAAGSARADRDLVDPLTGVLKAEHLNNTFQKVIARFRKEEHPVSLLILRVDYLYRYVEHYGEAVRDRILGVLGQLLEKRVREVDLIGRQGDDRFAIAMGAPPENALAAARRLAGEIRKHPFSFQDVDLKVSAGIGVAGCPEHGKTVSKLVQAAEEALRVSQTRGRGLCVLFEEQMGRREHPPPADAL
jgi:diguanylate cyclase (GGDEF)-like protein